MIGRLTSLSKNIVQFCIFLRSKEFSVGVEEESIMLEVLQFLDYTSYEAFFMSLKAVLCRSKTQWDAFDKLFREYWEQVSQAVDAKLKEEIKKKQPVSRQEQFSSLMAWLKGNQNKEAEETAAYSMNEALSRKDFSAVPESEVDELMRSIRNLSRRLAAKANRRYEFTRKIDLPDLRKTLRRNLRRGGELIDIIYRRPKRNRLKLLLLCDVSKSMELYSAFLLQFMYAFQQVYNRMETFVFSTSLKRITTLLKQKNFHDTLELLNTESEEWRAGTRIGESLNAFVEDYSRKLADSGTIVIILSDGWDLGNIDMLQKSMKIIHEKTKKVIWLNPLAGYADYRPDVAGMKAAMPYIDVFAPVYNAESLRKLTKWL